MNELAPAPATTTHNQHDDLQIAPIPDCAASSAPFGIYLHVPFCVRKCRYCDFVTYAGRNALIPDYVATLIAEIEATPQHWPGPLPTISTVFWGGGTPSLLPAAAIASVHDALARTFGWRAGGDVEATLEANPETVSLPYWRDLAAAGINRVSLGVQSLQPAGLQALDRDHDADTALQAVRTARQAGLDNLSLDLIFGWSGQTPALWQADLAQATALAPTHLSLYALTIEPGSALFADIARGRVQEPDDDEQADEYEAAREFLDAAGYIGYEISNWAQRGPASQPDRWQSQHNRLYWRNGEYLGFGVGAHSHFRGERFSNGRLVRRYMAEVAQGNHQPAFRELIDNRTAMTETMLLGLRLATGISRAAFRQRHGKTLDTIYADQLPPLLAQGLIEDDGASVRLSQRGRLLANEVLVHFVLDSETK